MTSTDNRVHLKLYKIRSLKNKAFWPGSFLFFLQLHSLCHHGLVAFGVFSSHPDFGRDFRRIFRVWSDVALVDPVFVPLRLELLDEKVHAEAHARLVAVARPASFAVLYPPVKRKCNSQIWFILNSQLLWKLFLTNNVKSSNNTLHTIPFKRE